MNDDKFPLCRRLGLTLKPLLTLCSQLAIKTELVGPRSGVDGLEPVLFPEEVEALLSAAPVVYGQIIPQSPGVEPRTFFDEYKEPDDTHTARLVMVEEIKCEAAEDLLRELLSDLSSRDWAGSWLLEYAARARKILGEK